MVKPAILTTTSPLSPSLTHLSPETQPPYIYKIVPLNPNNHTTTTTTTTTHIAAISSDDSLRLLDARTLRDITSGGRSRGIPNPVHDGVTCLQQCANGDGSSGGGGGGGGGEGGNLVWTAGRDGVARGFDLRVGQDGHRGLVMELSSSSDDSDAAYLSLACQQGTNNVAVGTELSHSQACVLIWDTRSSPRTPFRRYTESHNDDVTDLHFHPTRPRCLLSGSADGLVNIYDVAISDEDDALVQVANHGSSVSKAGFLSSSSSSSSSSSAGADSFFALSHDETFAVYHLNENNGQGGGDDATDNESPSSATVFGDLRSKLDCEYIVDVIPSRGSGGEEAIIAAGSHSERRLDLIPLRLLSNKNTKWICDPNEAIRLPGAHGEEIVRSVHVSNEDGTIFTAGEDGLVKAWRTSTDRGEDEKEGRAEAERPMKRKKRSLADGGIESGRFRPY